MIPSGLVVLAFTPVSLVVVRLFFADAGFHRIARVAHPFVVILLVFGPKRLPEIGRSLGRGMREVKTSVTGFSLDEPGESPNSPPAAIETRENDITV
jgi:TatA/E family protein of Tat protein translocase